MFYCYLLIQYEMVSGAFVWRADSFMEERKEGRASFYEQQGIASVILIIMVKHLAARILKIFIDPLSN